MKTINFKFIASFALLLCSLLSQSVFSDILIRKDPGPGTAPNIANRVGAFSTTSSQTAYYPVSADIVNQELIVDFSSAVGNATVSIVDQSGNTIYLTTISTFTSPELIIPITGWGSGNYTLKISYGTTRLIGSFQL